MGSGEIPSWEILKPRKRRLFRRNLHLASLILILFFLKDWKTFSKLPKCSFNVSPSIKTSSKKTLHASPRRWDNTISIVLANTGGALDKPKLSLVGAY